ncbi:MAG: hypothetical protein E2590_04820 [Chryseobacterium sp.]|nr:hypothetical protein [Chryseobacterium sp.]
MEFAITKELDTGTNKKTNLIQEISDNLKFFLKNKSYGEDIETFYIGFVGIKTKIGYEQFFKERKPRYVDYKQTKNRLTGEMMEIIKEYGYDIKFDNELYDEFVNGTDEESKNLLARKILESFAHFDKLPKKIKDFDKEKFKVDVEKFFKEQKII